MQRPADNYEAQFHPGKVVISRLDDGVETRMEWEVGDPPLYTYALDHMERPASIVGTGWCNHTRGDGGATVIAN